MREIYCLKWTGSGTVDEIAYTDKEEADIVAEASNKERSIFARLSGSHWVVKTLKLREKE